MDVSGWIHRLMSYFEKISGILFFVLWMVAERVGIGGDDRESVHQLSGQLVGPLIVDAAEVESPFVFWKDIVWNLFAVLVHPFKNPSTTRMARWSLMDDL